MEKIGRYRLQEQLGEGTTGTVYLARDHLIHRQVAIKTLRPDWLQARPDVRRGLELFVREARIIGRLSHSHITTIYDMGLQEGIPYFVMEYVKGHTIKEAIGRQLPFTPAEKVDILAMIARALHYAHQRGILHTDIKPANIIISESRLPKITDFGIARIMQQQERDLGAQPPGEWLCGTPFYMAPEQIRGEPLDPRCDLFSLGVVAYEWLGGRKPFTGKDMEACFAAVCGSMPAPLAQAGGIDPELAAIVHRALAKERAERYQSAEDFSDALELYRHSREQQEKPNSGRFSFNAARVVARLKERYVFFADFSEEELFTLFRLSGKEQFAGGDYLVRENTPGTKMYIIISGSVAIVSEANGRRVEIAKRLGEGACVGEMAIIDRLPRSASVLAREPTLAIAINETVLRLNHPKLCLKLYRNLATILCERLRQHDRCIRMPEADTRKEE